MIITPASVQGLFTQYDTRFSAAYAKFGTAPWYSNIAMEMPSRTAQTLYAWLAHLPAMRQWLGARQIQNLETLSYTIINKKFELTLAVQRTVLEDDQYDTYGPWMDQAAFQARKWPDQQIAPLLLQGNTANFGACYDGQNFFSTAHPIDPLKPSLGVQSNLFSGGYSLTWDNYTKVRASMMSLVRNDGINPLGVVPNLLVVPPQLEGIAKSIVESKTTAFSTLSGNAMVGGQDNWAAGTAKVLMIPELASQPTYWYLMDTRQAIMPLIWQLRIPVEFTYRNQLTDDFVFSNDAFKYGLRSRGAPGYGIWFLAAMATP
jgi:phage major head subunit gpT-like protein